MPDFIDADISPLPDHTDPPLIRMEPSERIYIGREVMDADVVQFQARAIFRGFDLPIDPTENPSRINLFRQLYADLKREGQSDEMARFGALASFSSIMDWPADRALAWEQEYIGHWNGHGWGDEYASPDPAPNYHALPPDTIDWRHGYGSPPPEQRIGVWNEREDAWGADLPDLYVERFGRLKPESMMTKKDFERLVPAVDAITRDLADLINEKAAEALAPTSTFGLYPKALVSTDDVRRIVAAQIADALDQHGNFDRAKFMAACEVKE